ncbi:YihY/virulence factor BrkB family protein [Halalkalibacterium halodurans]|jgi:membrane protein|uniref:BH3355 protein n=2 Tax=Halalkalibacterium halodurans TaxID=86665 RepID=Q9K7K6_HALH5|nr:YihY/virulence factor BrkB family protein [Halalkalibacterium halodurans]MDY7223887.1 YihY/virulence factor BrkB family protein [Halalkalibacterium halodurans]MDY7243108.1 YihY/virulence factor BrkB family protein [Halalkalibacterium halodurans]MED3648756.1 YihY/virulence factor BrkB family protein [Halalkalibacterium halodurans]MED4080631.1 YihY/virulence factor BrkB family protein [Halalkalibacterium halodurans]MED4085682.1 YihY/virulence factor BrkB family protein [Halalkalibacterium hal
MGKNTFFYQFFKQLKTDPIPDWSATLAYYFMLSIFPLIIFILALIPYFSIDQQYLYQIIVDYLPEDLADVFTSVILDVVSRPQGGLVSFGALAAIWTASNGMNALIRAVNRCYAVEETRSLYNLRFLSIMLTIGMMLVFVTTLLLPVFGHLIIQLLDWLFIVPEGTASVLNALRWIVGICLMTIILIVIYLLAPNTSLKLKDVVTGAVVATIGWQLISYGFSAYVSNFGNFSATYGSLGGVIVLMLWFFLSSLMLIIGGEVNAATYRLKQQQ